ncbi:Mov34/MPN/PAD-1 domain-containing protein, putative [Eimeria necatrix]|uniref:COP9 signalosome complex subunit 5 n=1 Tax=Eimeria necatrix TaxID=51315 RepID=U6MU01_9EIME|nr:Mov34/MPN/PAD-1 domain-containing protein, putative [Eimeria necatrix]CDJ65140.1 Mov34/MPN/PAD-1 domain-containing protein, putative [Eimeria necatrix]
MEPPPAPAVDRALYAFDEEAHNDLLHTLQQHNQSLRQKLQRSSSLQSPVAFTDVWISDLALAKMMAHAESGGKIEVMGLLLGKAVATAEPLEPGAPPAASLQAEEPLLAAAEAAAAAADAAAEAWGPQGPLRGYFVVTDCFALPVEGTETRVNAAEEANEYMIQFLEAAEKAAVQQKVVGWYHSHPDYGCWLSGIDVRTQQLQQQHQDPFLAIVLGAFRTFLPGETRREDEAEAGESPSQLLPAEKVNDFGAHWQQYYRLRVHYCCNSLSARLLEGMCNATWPQVLAGPSLRRNRPLELRRLEAILESCDEAISAAASSQPAPAAEANGQEMGDGFELEDNTLAAEYSEELEFASQKEKDLSDRLLSTAEKAADIAVRALGGEHEAAALSAIYRDTTWRQEVLASSKREEQ